MTEAVLERDQVFLNQLARLGIAENGPAWMQELRREAVALVNDQGLPTTESESWRYTDLKSLASLPFILAPEQKGIEKVEELSFLDDEWLRLVYCNGHLKRTMSAVGDLPQGMRVTSLSEMLAEEAVCVRNHLSGVSSFREGVFNALNLALSSEGAVIEIPEGIVVDRPIHLVFINEADSEPFMVHPRVLILAGRNSQVSVVETHLGLTESTYFANSVTEIVASENAAVDYYKLQREGANAYHVGTVDSYQGRSANVRTGIITLSGKLVRNNTKAEFGGEGGYAELNGLFLASSDHHVDNHTTIEHAQPHCSSRELYKGILSEKARGVFRGRIVVAEGAQKTDSKQTNNNLLLSDDAFISTRPQLEIYADDVKCTHGATIGQLEEEAMFYLRTRGIGREAARSMLTYAFASEVVNEVRLPALQKQLDNFLFDWLPGGALVRK